MGVPSFYRWLVNKYPNVVVNVKEEEEEDSTLRNPNGIEFDNLYLDMNGIIHPCFHPDDHLFPPTTFESVFNNIFEYIDRIFNIVRPRKLLYMAIDGVAPRAKMNQQRSRRFRTAKDNEIFEAEEERLRKQFEMNGKPVLPKQESEVSDSNIITPGTEFMYKLSKELQRYICQRIENDAGWKDIKVILSDANVPGEGEHKIMSYIRLQRTFPDYNPDTRHCLYGLDADLIMLALATHEIHFSILREDVLVQEQKPSYASAIESSLCKAKSSLGSTGCVKQAQADRVKPSLVKKPYQFLNVWILREYLKLDMEISDPPENFKVDFERLIDDIVFICFFAGNDFLPHMPSLEIHEGAIDLLMYVYKKEFKNMKGYLVDTQRVEDKKAGYLKFSRLEKFILSVGAFEEKIFKKRSDMQERKHRRMLSDLADAKDEEEEDSCGNLELNKIDMHCEIRNGSSPTSRDSTDVTSELEILMNTKELKEKLKDNIRKTSDVFKNGGFRIDKVRFGATGWKERYYKEKFSAESASDIESTRKAIVEKYTEGLCWVLLYYYSGVPSWTWFYPYHYGPFASDLKGLGKLSVRFQKGVPFKPFNQLMGVLPQRSAHALPKGYQSLMTDEASSIIDFYPNDFDVDISGKRFMWQGISKLPFIEEERLLTVTRLLEKDLKEDEAIRNSTKVDQLFVRSSSKLGSQILSVYKKQVAEEQNEMIKIDTSLSEGINGIIHRHEGNMQDKSVLCALYELPHERLHIPRLLEGVNIPEKKISEADIVETQLWHEYQGGRPNVRPQYQQKWHGSSFNNRPQCQERNRYNVDINIPNSTTNSSPGVITKCAGSGWAGRGKECMHTTDATFRVPSSSELNGPMASWNSRGRGCVGHVTSTSQQNNSSGTFPVTHDFNAKTATSSIQGEANGFRDLTISEPSQGFNSYGRAQSMNNNSWSSRNFGRAQSVNNNSWSSRNFGRAQPVNHYSFSSGNASMPSRNYGARPSVESINSPFGHGPRGSTYYGNYGVRPSESIQGEANGFRDLRISEPSQGINAYGRAQSVNHHSWSSRNIGRAQPVNHTSVSSGNATMPSRNYGVRPRVESINTPLGHGATADRNNQWRQSMSASFGHGPRGGNSEYEWRQCVQNPAFAPSVQPRGASASSRNSINNPRNYGH